MDSFQIFINSLSDQELLSVLIFRNRELNLTQKQNLDAEIVKRGIVPDNYEELTAQIRKQQAGEVYCPRCLSTRLFSDREEKFPDFRTVFLTWKYIPCGLRANYECIVCAHKFKKRLSLKYIIELFEKD